MPPDGYWISPSELFVYFFVMLGPIKLLAPFSRVSRGADAPARHRLALRATAISTIALVAAATLGTALLSRWQVSTPALILAASMVLFWVAFRVVTGVYAGPGEAREPPPAHDEEPPRPAPPIAQAAMTPVAFPGIVTPYGVALVILVVASARDAQRLLTIAGALALILALDLLAMWFARPLMKALGASLQILGAVLGVLQVALAVELGIQALGMLGVLDAPPL